MKSKLAIKLKSTVKYVLALTITVFLCVYLARHWQELKSLSNITLPKIIFMYSITLLTTFIAGLANKLLLNSLNTRTKFLDMVLLHNAVYLLNYVPMKFGTLFRANYLKKHYNLSFAHFGTFFMYLTLIMTFTAPMTGIIVLLSLCDIKLWPVQILSLVFIFFLVISFIFLFVPVSQIKGRNKIIITINNFLKGRNDVIKDKKTLLFCAILMNINFVLGSIRPGIIYNSLGQNVHPAGFLILGAVGYFLMFITLTPGSIGIRELVLGAASVVIGVPMQVGIPAAMIDRAIAVTYSFVAGGLCAIYLWNKNPQDFKNLNKDNLGLSPSSQSGVN